MTEFDEVTPEMTVRAREVAALFERASVPLTKEPTTAPLRCMARAPGRLDVIGGLAEYTGALVLGTPLSDGVTVTVQRRADGRVSIYGLSAFSELGGDSFVFDLASMEGGSASFVDTLPEVPWVRAAAGAIRAMLATGKIEGNEAGLTLAVEGSMPPLVDVGMTASVAVAVVMAATQVWDLKFDPAECVQLALRADNDAVGYACGIGAAACALHAVPGCLTQVYCHDTTIRDLLPLPENITILGVDTGFKFDDAKEKYERARAATFMGRRLIDRIVEAVDGFPFRWTGSLSQIPVSDYVGHLRDRFPTKIKGVDFLDRIGETSDPLTHIEPDRTYKIRSRTEHHIYEADRTHQFAERIGHFSRTGERKSLVDAGQLMYASHWSYGQRCGLGSVETDRLVTLLRNRGVEAGIYGARVSAQGSGGVVVVMLESGAKARETLASVISEYEADMSRTARVYDGTSSGALAFGVHTLG